MAQSIIPEGIVGNSKRLKLWESFYLAWSVGMTNHRRSLKIVCRSPLNGSEFLKTWLRCQVSSPRKGVWNCIVSELVFGLEFCFRCRLEFFLGLETCF